MNTDTQRDSPSSPPTCGTSAYVPKEGLFHVLFPRISLLNVSEYMWHVFIEICHIAGETCHTPSEPEGRSINGKEPKKRFSEGVK